LFLATALGILASLKLWLTTRDFPLVPVVSSFPQFPSPWDDIFLGLIFVTLVGAFKFYRPAITLFLLGALFLYCGDQNRGQPWFYLDCVLFVLTLLPDPIALAACRLIVSIVYIWAAIQKFGPEYQRLIVPYMLEPASKWLPQNGVSVARWLINEAPVVELFIGIGLWVPFLRRTAIAATILIHAIVLLLLGPFGHNYNLVVWPWNLEMIALVIVLFPSVTLSKTLREVRQSSVAILVALLVATLPVLGYFGWWDSYFSFAVYSGNTATADMIVVPSLVERLPEPIRQFAHPLHPDVIAANPGLRGLYVFDVQSWAQNELGVPPIPEPRNYRAISRYVAKFAEQPSDIQLIITPRRGPVAVYKASDLR